MPRTVFRNGQAFVVPDEWDEPAVSQAIIEGASDELLAVDPALYDAEQMSPELFREWAENTSPLMAGLIEMRSFIGDRLPDNQYTRPATGPMRQALREAHPVATGIGGAYFPIAGALAAPASAPIQGAVAGGLEAAKYFNAGTDLMSIGKETLWGYGGQKLGDMAERVVRGAAAVATANKVGKPLVTQSRTARAMSETSLGRGVIERANQKLLFRKLGQVFGIDDMQKIGADEFAEGFENIGKLYDDALNISTKPNTAGAVKRLQQIEGQVPNRAALIKALQAADDPASARAAHRALRDTARKMRNNPLSQGFTDELDDVIGIYNQSLEAAGADLTLLNTANQRFKLWANVLESPDAWIDEVINPRALLKKMGRDTYKGFGRTVKMGRKQSLDPAVADFLDTVEPLARDVLPFGRSGTAERLLPWLSGGGVAGVALGTGDPVLTTAAAVGIPAVSELAGLASVGQKSGIPGKAAVAGLQALDEYIEGNNDK